MQYERWKQAMEGAHGQIFSVKTGGKPTTGMNNENIVISRAQVYAYLHQNF